MTRLPTRWRFWLVLGAAAALVAGAVGCRKSLERQAEEGISFRDATDDAGIDFVHVDGSSGRRYVVESMSAGVATFDYDGDGLIDIYFPNGAPLPGASYDRPPRHALYKNLGDWKFQDATEQAGVASTAYGMGVAVGDYDADGRPDLYLSNFGLNVLYRNNGDGTFSDVTARAGVARDAGGRGQRCVGAGAAFLDYDGDGRLDLYVGNYMELDLAGHVPRVINGVASYPSPKDYAPVPDTLYRNKGDGTFADVSQASGVGRRAGRSMGLVCADIDDDGATDVFVLNDVQENFLFHNDGRGRFVEIGLAAGVAVNGAGEALANMGVDCGDFDNDGRLDFYSTNYQGQWPMLLRNRGAAAFEDVTATTNAGAGMHPLVNWGCGLVDFDNDGRRDLFVGNGHTEDNVEEFDKTTCYRCRNTVLQNGPDGRFADVSGASGVAALAPHAARGVAFDDLDNDGDVDAVVLNSRERPTLLRNLYVERGGKNHWLQVRLQGAKTNRDGVGARVVVSAGDLRLIDEVHAGRGYQSHWGTRLHFGLGAHDRVDRIEVRWIGGGAEAFENVVCDRSVALVEGTGTAVAKGPKNEAEP